jgi:hypothetical protein
MVKIVKKCTYKARGRFTEMSKPLIPHHKPRSGFHDED